MSVLDFLADSFEEGGWAISNYRSADGNVRKRSELARASGIALVDPPLRSERPRSIVQLFIERRLFGVVLSLPKDLADTPRLVEQASRIYSTDMPSWMIHDRLPFVYFSSEQELRLIDSSKSIGIERLTTVRSLDESLDLIRRHRGQSSTRLQPLVNQMPCVCASGWVTTRSGASWEAFGECRFCRERRNSGPRW